MNIIVYRTRVLLIRLGKVLPFVVCALVLISYIENIYALYNENYLTINNVVILNKPISYFIGSYFEYNALFLSFLIVVSFAISTCLHNKLANLYLAINLYEKSYFASHVYENEIYYVVCIVNMIVAAYLTYKGLKIITKTLKQLSIFEQ